MHRADAKVIKIVHAFLIVLVFHLVDGQHHRLIRPAQHIRDLVIRAYQPRLGVRQKQDDVRRLHGHFRLPAHLRQDDILTFRFDAAGVHQHKLIPQPFRVLKDPIARHARRVLDNCNAPLADFIE